MTKNPNLKNKNSEGGGGGGSEGGIGEFLLLIYKLTENPNLIFFAGEGDGGEGRGLVYVHKQMFQMTLLLFKEKICGKLF